MQRPINNNDEVCPLHRKPVKKVCHTCPWFIKITGMNPQDGTPMDHWNCAIALQPILAIETAQQERLTGASVDKLRAEVQKTSTIGIQQNQIFLRMIAEGMEQQQARIAHDKGNDNQG